MFLNLYFCFCKLVYLFVDFYSFLFIFIPSTFFEIKKSTPVGITQAVSTIPLCSGLSW